MKIDVAGGTISAEIKGEGRPLVLFHSLLSDRGSWVKVTDTLAQRFRVVVPELPGFGESTAVDNGLMGFGDRMAELLRHVTTDRKPYVVGNGFGSFVALQMVIRHPDLVEKLVMAAGGAGFTDEGRQAFRNMIGGAQAKGLAGIADVAMRRLFAPEFQAANPEIMADRRAAFLKMDPAVFVSACTTLSQMDLRAEAAKVTVPILALCGEEDEATPPAMSKELAEIVPGTRLILLPGCAHVPQMQKPKEFLDAIDGFLN